MPFSRYLRPRLLPVVILAAGALLSLKIGNVWFALEAKAATGSEQVPPGATSLPIRSEPAGKPLKDPIFMSPSEVEVLQKLSERRAELDQREAALAQREVIMRATEQRVEEKIAKLQALEKGIGDTIKKQDDEDESRLKSLVRIYENMKPAEAARVFAQIDTPTLVSLVEKMRELKTAPILASMDPEKAKQLTLALADRRNQPAASAPKAQPAALTAPAGSPGPAAPGERGIAPPAAAPTTVAAPAPAPAAAPAAPAPAAAPAGPAEGPPPATPPRP